MCFLDFRWLEGDLSYVGERLLGSLLFHRPELLSMGKTGLARLRRAIKGFAKACPPRSRVPLPWERTAALAAIMHRNGKRPSAVALLTSFDTYIRPGALMQLQVGDVLRPLDRPDMYRWGLQLFPQERGVLSKTGTQDDTVLFGSFDINMGALMKMTIEGRRDDELLFPQGMRSYNLDFKDAARLLGLGPLNLVTYQARHGGATRDILMQRREMEEVRKRGQ